MYIQSFYNIADSKSYKRLYYLYNFVYKPILSSEIGKQKVSPPKYPNAKELSPEFYEGFGYDIYQKQK